MQRECGFDKEESLVSSENSDRALDGFETWNLLIPYHKELFIHLDSVVHCGNRLAFVQT